MNGSSALVDLTPKQIALGKNWVETGKHAAVDLERIKRREIRELDTYKTISLLVEPPITPRPLTRQSPGPD